MKNFIRDMLDQVWTGLGMFVAWLVLDGSEDAFWQPTRFAPGLAVVLAQTE